MILAIETSTMVGSVALVAQGRLVAEYTLNIKRTHSERLMPTVERVIRDAALKLEDLTGIAVAVGPGSFTGLRIGVTCAKTLAYTMAKPLIAIPTLDAMAFAVAARGLTCPLLFARRGEVYTALYQTDGQNLPVKKTDYLAITLDRLGELLRQEFSSSLPLYLTGDAATAAQTSLAAHNEVVVLPWTQQIPRAGAVGELAYAYLAAGKTADPMTLAPLYVRRPDVKPPQGVGGCPCA